MRSSYKIVILTLLGVLFFTPVVLASDSIQAQNVLILFAFESGLPANDLIYKNLRATLDSQINEPVNYYIEYLDRSRFPDEEYQRQLFDLYKKNIPAKKLMSLFPLGRERN
jgi:hypothetical protein